MQSSTEKAEIMKNLLNSSPFYHQIGMRIESFTNGTSCLILDATEAITNIFGTVHGGGLAALIDSACGMALATKLDEDEIAVTINLNVQYIRPAKPGKISAYGHLISRSRTIGVGKAEIFQSDGELLALGSTVHLITHINHE